jgi:hypothetical protein
MKRVLPLLIICALVSCKQNESDIRKHFFPKAEIKVNVVPKKENLWVFILAGQSNMAGRGLVEPQDTIPSQRIFTLNKDGAIILAKEPLHYYEPNAAGLDCGLSFARNIVEHIPDSISLLIIPAAVGGSSISHWLGDSTYRNVKLLTNFRQKTELAYNYGVIKGILWHQGESDANQNDIPSYSIKLAALLVKFRDIVDNDSLPVLIGELGSFSNNQGDWININKQINLYASSDSNTIVVKTADLKDKGDKVHYNSEGQRILGQRFAQAFISYFK